MKRRQYVKRELAGVFLYPIVFSLLVLLFVYSGLVKAEYSELFSCWTLITILSGTLAFLISYVVAFGHRGRRR